MKRLLYLFILFFAAISYAKDYPVAELGHNEYIECFGVDGYAYIFTDENETAVKFVEPYENHISYPNDNFTGYQQKSEFNIPNSISYNGKVYEVVAIEYGALTATPNAISISIPSSIKIIEPYAIHGPVCKYLKIDNGVQKIMSSNFNKFWEAEIDLVLPSSLHEIQSDCFNNTAFLSVEIEEGLEFLGDNCFSDNPNLTSIKLPETLRHIGKGCFRNLPNLKKINIPRWLRTSSDLGAILYNLKSIEEISFSSRTPYGCNEYDIEQLKFDPSKVKLIIPDGCSDIYKERGWGIFNIVEKGNVSVENNTIASPTQETRYFNLNGTELKNDSASIEGVKLQKKGPNGAVVIINR